MTGMTRERHSILCWIATKNRVCSANRWKHQQMLMSIIYCGTTHTRCVAQGKPACCVTAQRIKEPSHWATPLQTAWTPWVNVFSGPWLLNRDSLLMVPKYLMHSPRLHHRYIPYACILMMLIATGGRTTWSAHLYHHITHGCSRSEHNARPPGISPFMGETYRQNT